MRYAAAPKQIQGKLGRRRECHTVSEWKSFSPFERQKGYFLQSLPSVSYVVVCVLHTAGKSSVEEQQSKEI